MDQKYNGMRNFETWLIWTWILEGEFLGAQYWEGQARGLLDNDTCVHKTHKLSELLTNHVVNSFEDLSLKGAFNDLLGSALNSVDWYALAEHFFTNVVAAQEEHTDENNQQH